MAQKKVAIKSQKSKAGSRRKGDSENGACPPVSSKSSSNSSIKATDERMLRLWKKIYEDHHPQTAKRG